MSNKYLPYATMDGKWSRTNQRFEGSVTRYQKTTGAFQSGYVENRRSYPYHDNEKIPSAEVPGYRRFARDAPQTHPMDQPVVPEHLHSVPKYQLGRIMLVVDSDPRQRLFALSRKYFRSNTEPLFVDDRGEKYFSVQHFLQMKMMLFFSGLVPESEPHFQSSPALRAAALENQCIFEETRPAIQSVSDLKRIMGNLKLREFNFDFWFQSQTILDAMVEANFLKFSQNSDLRHLLLHECGNEHSLFMEVSGFDQCFFGAGYTLEFLQRTNHFYTDRPQLWRGWNNFGESLRLTRRLLHLSAPVAVAQTAPPEEEVGSKRTRHGQLEH